MEDNMIFINFNQDSTSFVMGLEYGFRVYNTSPLKNCFERKLDGGIGIVELLYKSNYIALVGGGKFPKYSKNKVIIWDDKNSQIVCELKFSSEVKNVKLKKEKIYVVCDQKIYVYQFADFQLIEILETSENIRGIIAVSSDKNINVVAFPDKTKGYVRVKSYEKSHSNLIPAHESTIACLSLNQSGTLLATASDKVN